MELIDGLDDLFGRIRDHVHGVVEGLDAEALSWRPDPHSNPIAWLVWHLTRVQDDHVAELAGRDQIWTTQGWAERFGLPPDYADTGYGHTPEQVAAVVPVGPQVLTGYHDPVAELTRGYLADTDPSDFERVVDRSYDPPVTAGVRIVSVAEDALQHLGQAAYVRGLYERAQARS